MMRVGIDVLALPSTVLAADTWKTRKPKRLWQMSGSLFSVKVCIGDCCHWLVPSMSLLHLHGLLDLSLNTSQCPLSVSVFLK